MTDLAARAWLLVLLMKFRRAELLLSAHYTAPTPLSASSSACPVSLPLPPTTTTARSTFFHAVDLFDSTYALRSVSNVYFLMMGFG